MVAAKPSDSVFQHERHGVWVPAFAGTTAVIDLSRSVARMSEAKSGVTSQIA